VPYVDPGETRRPIGSNRRPSIDRSFEPKSCGISAPVLERCDHGTNFVSGGLGAPLDFITYHAKGQVSAVDGHVRMGIAKNAETWTRDTTSCIRLRSFAIMAWNYRDDDLASPEAGVQVDISGFPRGVSRVSLRHYPIDDPQQFLDCVEEMGSLDQPSLEQYAALAAAHDGEAKLHLTFPRQSVWLLQLNW
jgi:hypothetical protein